jgi:hypothetical protein
MCRRARAGIAEVVTCTPLLSGTMPPSGDTTRQVGFGIFMPGANPAAASSTSSVMETLVAKAPGSTRTVKSYMA